MYRKLWSGGTNQKFRAIRTYLAYAPEAFRNFVAHPLLDVLSGCLYDDAKGVNGRGRLHANILEKSEKWDRFHQTSHLNGRPVFIEMADQLSSLELNFVSEDRI